MAEPPAAQVKLVGSVAHVLDTALDGLPGRSAAASTDAFTDSLREVEANIEARQARLRTADAATYQQARSHHLLPVTEFVLPRHEPAPLPSLPLGVCSR